MPWFLDENFWKDVYDWLFPPESFELASKQVEKIIQITGLHFFCCWKPTNKFVGGKPI